MLETVTLPNSITEIGKDVFGNCWALKSIDIPDGVTTIGYAAFQESWIESINIPSSVTHIGTQAFYLCGSLKCINYDGAIEEWNAVAKANDWDGQSSNYTIYCTDGEIAKDGTVTYY
jgi:hypothetical protein